MYSQKREQTLHIRASKSNLSGTIKAPASKSHSIRAILFASMANGKSEIFNYLDSPDTHAMIEAMNKLGAIISIKDNNLIIQGFANKPVQPDDVINAGNSGQVLRFISPILASQNFYSIITGDHSIRFYRPMKEVIKALQQLGASCISLKGDGFAPLIIKGPITNSEISIDGQDSQPVSAIIMASVFFSGKTVIKVSNPGEIPWVQLTLTWLDFLKVKYKNYDFTHYEVFGSKHISGFKYNVPGDFSSIAYPMVAAIINKSKLTICNINMQDSQGDKKLIQVLHDFGANIKIEQNILHILPASNLSGINVDVNEIIDALPILAVVSCYAKGTSKLYNAQIARNKESDRLSTITKELRKMGANIEEREDSLIIHGSNLKAAEVYAHNDHRIAMSLIVAATGITQASTIKGTECIKKSYPDFINSMQNIGMNLQVI